MASKNRIRRFLTGNSRIISRSWIVRGAHKESVCHRVLIEGGGKFPDACIEWKMVSLFLAGQMLENPAASYIITPLNYNITKYCICGAPWLPRFSIIFFPILPCILKGRMYIFRVYIRNIIKPIDKQTEGSILTVNLYDVSTSEPTLLDKTQWRVSWQ